ncbi:MAG: hypothetical protein AAFR28_06295 [Pseudomonadota bacterium]
METLTIFAGFVAAWLVDPIAVGPAAVIGLLVRSWKWAAVGGAAWGVAVAAIWLFENGNKTERELGSLIFNSGWSFEIAAITAGLLAALGLQAIRQYFGKSAPAPRRSPQSRDSSA